MSSTYSTTLVPKPPRNRRPRWTLIPAGMLLLGCQRSALPPPPPPVVQVTAAVRTDSARDLRLSGTIEAERSIALSFAVAGTVEAVLVQEGNEVG